MSVHSSPQQKQSSSFQTPLPQQQQINDRFYSLTSSAQLQQQYHTTSAPLFQTPQQQQTTTSSFVSLIDVNGVAAYLRKHQIAEKVVSTFVANEIDGSVFLSLTSEDLENYLHINNFVQRKKIFSLIQEARDSITTPASSSSSLSTSSSSSAQKSPSQPPATPAAAVTMQPSSSPPPPPLLSHHQLSLPPSQQQEQQEQQQQQQHDGSSSCYTSLPPTSEDNEGNGGGSGVSPPSAEKTPLSLRRKRMRLQYDGDVPAGADEQTTAALLDDDEEPLSPVVQYEIEHVYFNKHCDGELYVKLKKVGLPNTKPMSHPLSRVRVEHPQLLIDYFLSKLRRPSTKQL